MQRIELRKFKRGHQVDKDTLVRFLSDLPIVPLTPHQIAATINRNGQVPNAYGPLEQIVFDVLLFLHEDDRKNEKEYSERHSYGICSVIHRRRWGRCKNLEGLGIEHRLQTDQGGEIIYGSEIFRLKTEGEDYFLAWIDR